MATVVSPRFVVIGGGIAGLTAALRAAECGFTVTVLEQGRDARYPCNSRFSGGIIHAAYHDVNRPAAELRAIMDRATRNSIEPALADAIANDGRRLLAWLRGHDVRFMRVGPLEAHRWCMAPPRPIGPGLDWQGRGPDAMLRTLTQRLQALGGSIVLGARATRLLMVDGHCAGVAGTNADGGEQAWPAAAVVIADGGFQANAALFTQHIGPTPARVLQRGAATGRGDGVAMASAVGAATRGMDTFYGHLHSRAALNDTRVWPYPELDAVATAALVVGPDGKRIVDEGLGGIGIANALARLSDPASATLICDAATWEGPGRSARFPANPFLERYGGPLLRAANLAALAELAGLPAGALVATVARYNAALADGTLDCSTPPRSSLIKPWPVVVAPFIAIPLCVGITYTMGGIAIDGDGRVQRDDGSSIAGLYAAGATTAGIEGGIEGGRVGYVGGLIRAVFGLRAAEHAAALVGLGARQDAAIK